MKELCCAILSDPPDSFAWGYDEEDEYCVALKLLMLNRISLLHSDGLLRFAIGMNAGAGLYAAEIVGALQETNEKLLFDCYVAYEGLAIKWHHELRDRYYKELASCAEVYTRSPRRTTTCELDSFLDAIDAADMVLAVCSAEEAKSQELSLALRYAQRMRKQIIVIRPIK